MLTSESYFDQFNEEQPCGIDLESENATYIELDQLERLTKGRDAQEIGEGDNKITTSAEPPEWRAASQAAEALLLRSCDLRALVVYIQSLANINGYDGLRVGLSILEQAIELHWRSVFPLLDAEDGNDPTQRLNIICGLCDIEKILQPLRVCALVRQREVGQHSLRDALIAKGKMPAPEGEGAPQWANILSVMRSMEEADLVAIRDSIQQSRSSLTNIDASLANYVGAAHTPDLAPLHDLLKEALSVINSGLNEKQGVADEIETDASSDSGSRESSHSAALRPIQSRRDVMHALGLICDYYRIHEPSSPVPFMLKRAQSLVEKDFYALLQDLLPESYRQFDVIKGSEE